MNNLNQNERSALIERYTPKSRHLLCGVRAFFIGGCVSALGEALRRLYLYLGVDKELSFTLVGVTVIAIAAALTGFGVFDKMARVGGAGLLVPISGFSNSITSEALDSKSEGYIMGVGAKIFTVAGPVLLYGIASGVVYGVIYYVTTKILGFSF